MNCFWKLIIGLLITAVDLEVNIGTVSINIFSDLIGYILIIMGVTEMIPWSPCFKKSRKHAILSIFAYIGMQVSKNMRWGTVIDSAFLGLGTMFFIYLTYYVMEGLYVKNKTEKIYEINQQLKGSWIALAISAFLYCFLMIADLESVLREAGYVEFTQPILIGVGVITLVIESFYLLTLNQNRTLLEAKQNPEQTSTK